MRYGEPVRCGLLLLLDSAFGSKLIFAKDRVVLLGVENLSLFLEEIGLRKGETLSNEALDDR